MSGLFSVLSAGHIGHDGGHFAISRRYPLLNDIGVWGFFLVSNPIIWQHQHTYAHHSFTNDEHRDPDLHHHNGQMLKRPDKEVTKNKNREGKRYHWRNIAKLGFAVFGLSWWLPILFVCDRTFYGITEWSDRRQWHRTGQLLLHWSLYAFIVFCVPFMVHQNSLLAIFQIVLQVYTAGIIFAMSTKVGHIADALLNTNVIAEQRTKRHLIAQQSWAAEQIVTTQDFDPQSYATFYFANGLSLQIEHHLFPSLNHCHLMKIQPIVEKTCNEYNVSYTKRSSWTEAWNDLLEYLDSLVK
jgi:fatty acid desaturase